MPRDGSQSTPARKIRKITRACDACKFKKKACTGTLPCGPCVRRKLDCTYDTSYHRGTAVSPPSLSLCPLPDQSSGLEARKTSLQHGQDQNVPEVADQYWGPTSAYSFLGRAVLDLPTSPSNAIPSPRDGSEDSSTSIFAFGDRAVPEFQSTDFEWPDRETAESLVRRYFEFASPTYRILHQPTVEAILCRRYRRELQNERITMPVACKAILLLVFSMARMFQMDSQGRLRDADDRGWRTSDLYYSKANHILSRETGKPALESAQARFLMVLYLVSSSRAQKAWFTLGTTIQLMMALGLHSRHTRKDTDAVDLVQRECQRRIVWCSYTLDKYLSVVLGRPRLWHDEDLDKELPTRVNDQDLTSNAIKASSRDCMMDAPVFHALLARILAQAAREPYIVAGISTGAHIQTLQGLCSRVAEWQAELPPFLSGVIHPSSLVLMFRRQLTVLQLARYHALMFITRPLLLRNYGQIWPDCRASYSHHLRTCLTAARDAVELILSFVCENQLFHAFWYSQYIAFNALSIIYIYLIQVRRGRIVPVRRPFPHSQNSPDEAPLDESMLYGLSETAQHHLADATIRNAPSWKYSAILQSLRRGLQQLGPPTGRSHCLEDTGVKDSTHGTSTAQAADGLMNGANHELRNQDSTRVEEILGEITGASNSSLGANHSGEPSLVDARTESLFGNFAMDKDLILDFWPQLDSLPVSKCPLRLLV